jgi:hypothetical protein
MNIFFKMSQIFKFSSSLPFILCVLCFSMVSIWHLAVADLVGFSSACSGVLLLAGVIYTDSVDRTPELALRPRIPWTEHQNSRCDCVHGFRGPNTRTLVAIAFTDSVDRMPEVSLRSRIPWTECRELSLRPRISWTLLHTNQWKVVVV